MKDLKRIFEEIDTDDVDIDGLTDDDTLVEDMVDLLLDIDPDSLTDEQAERLDDIVSRIEGYEDDESAADGMAMDEAAPARRVRRNKAAQRQRSREYRRHRTQLKQKAKRYRKSARGKLLAKKRERMSKRGLTATGQRKRTYINK